MQDEFEGWRGKAKPPTPKEQGAQILALVKTAAAEERTPVINGEYAEVTPEELAILGMAQEPEAEVKEEYAEDPVEESPEKPEAEVKEEYAEVPAEESPEKPEAEVKEEPIETTAIPAGNTIVNDMLKDRKLKPQEGALDLSKQFLEHTNAIVEKEEEAGVKEKVVIKKAPKARGGLKKAYILAAIGILGASSFVYFQYATSAKKEEETIRQEESRRVLFSEKDLALEAYANQDNTAHREDVESVENTMNDLKEEAKTSPSVEKLLGIKTPASATTPLPASPPKYSPSSSTPSRPTPPPTDSMDAAIKSPIEMRVNGFGGAAGKEEAIASKSPMPFSIPGIMSKDEYVQDAVAQYSELLKGPGGATMQYPAATGGEAVAQQPPKDSLRYSEQGKYNTDNSDAGNMRFLDDATVFPGTMINAVLVSGINTDYPSDIIARVSENVFDSKTGLNLLIPQGSLVVGSYSSSSVGVSRVQVAWSQLILNKDGISYMVDLGAMPGVDSRGRSGVSGFLNDHYFEWLKAAGIMTLFSVLNSEVRYQGKVLEGTALASILDQNLALVNQFGTMVADRAMEIQPSVTVANGKRIAVMVNTPLQLVPYERERADQKYQR